MLSPPPDPPMCALDIYIYIHLIYLSQWISRHGTMAVGSGDTSLFSARYGRRRAPRADDTKGWTCEAWSMNHHEST